jgi:iron complex transport system ATP-binding protein
VAVNARDLRVGYGTQVVVDGLSIDVPDGSFCSIIGPNGCGKSTVLKALSRNLGLISGSIEILGKPLQEYDTRILSRKLAFLSQSPPVPEQFSVRELVSHGRYPYTRWFGFLTAHDREVIDWALERTGIQEFSERELVHLSGGERQRVWIAMALAQEAEVLLLDEPTTHLDIAHQFQTLELIHRLQTEMGRTIITVLHDLNQAARYSDHIFVMKDGQQYAEGTPDEMITREMLREVFSVEARVIRDTGHNCPYFIPLRSVIPAGAR